MEKRYYLELCDTNGCDTQDVFYSDMQTAIEKAKRFLLNPRIEYVKITNAHGDVKRVIGFGGFLKKMPVPGGGGGGVVMKMTNEVKKIHTNPIDPSHFTIPDDYKQTEAK